MKLCVFQGTFNPIHNAHLRVCDFVLETFSFDKLLVIPAFKPPHKNFNQNYAEHRLNMVKLAFDNNARIEVSDIEYTREGKSYTYLTILQLYKLYDVEGKINFIIGTDAFEKIESWYEADKLKNLVKFIVFVREDNFEISRYDYLRSKGFEFEFQTLPYEDISSTELRSLIRQGLNVSLYIPKSVEEYISKNELYKD